ncbi:MAG TPA: hypothetical protein VF217_03560 [Rhodanobacteraceae bacterium]
MLQTTVQFGDWLPDDDRNITPGAPAEAITTQAVPLQDAKNMLFTGASWRLYRPLSVSGSALAATPRDAITVDASGTLVTFAAAGTKLYKIQAGAITDVSGAQTFSGSAPWVFQQFGDCLLATNGTDVVQDFDLTNLAGTFAALAGSPPKAATIGMVRDFVVLGNVNDGAAHPYRVQWSAISNPTQWPAPLTQAARAAQSGYQDCYSQYGTVQYIAQGEEFGLIFQQRGIVRMQYVGGDVVFNFYTFERKRGLLTPKAAAQVGNMVYFLSGDGFYATDGNGVDPIGYGKVNRWFFGRCYDTSKVRAAVDTNTQCVYWSFPSTSGANDYVIAFNYAEGKWSYGVDTTYALFQSLQSGAHIPQAFDASSKLGTFSGTQSDGEIVTKLFRLQPNQRCMVLAARPLVDSVCTVAVSAQASDDATQTFGGFVSRASRSMKIPLRANGYLHALDVKLGSATTYAQGVQLDYVARGRM